MIKVVILEDEIPARNKLKRYLSLQKESIQLVAELDSVESAIEFLSSKPTIDLLISDIELLDGNVFEVFDQVELPCPIIFTTAYNQFWMEAFEGNGIEYLLKPYGQERFEKAWAKFLRLKGSESSKNEVLEKLQLLLLQQNQPEKQFKKRLKVPSPRGSYFLDLEEIAYVMAENAVVKAVEIQGKKHLLQEATLKEIEHMVDPDEFFRISRSHLVQKRHVNAIERYSKNSVAIKLAGTEQLLICSQSATPSFLKWMEE